MTAQEASEKKSRITITAFGNGPELCTRSQTSNCRNKPPTHAEYQPGSFRLNIMSLHFRSLNIRSIEPVTVPKTMISRRHDFSMRAKNRTQLSVLQIALFYSMTQNRRGRTVLPVS